jgi:hypothetical protein
MKLQLGEAKMAELARRTRKSTLSQMVFHRRSDRTARATHRDPYTWESDITTDPKEFFQRGQMIFGFEPDDPAPAYMQAALGDWGAKLPMFSVDYGHWDGEVKGCVDKLAKNESIPVPVRRLALGENAMRFYGERLERTVAEVIRDEGADAGSAGTVG